MTDAQFSSTKTVFSVLGTFLRNAAEGWYFQRQLKPLSLCLKSVRPLKNKRQNTLWKTTEQKNTKVSFPFPFRTITIFMTVF